MLSKEVQAMQAEAYDLEDKCTRLGRELSRIDTELYVTGPEKLGRSLREDELPARRELYAKRELVRISYLATEREQNAKRDALMANDEYKRYLDRELAAMRAEGYVF